MQIGSIGKGAAMPQFDRAAASKMKQNFEKLDSAISAGDMAAAKEVLGELQKNAPKGGGNNPMSAKIEALSKAVDSGDVQGAQAAFAEIKKAAPQRPPMGGAGGMRGAGGPPPGGKKAEASEKSSTADKTYDAKDTNHDGKVSSSEELISELNKKLSASKGSAQSFEAYA